MNTNLKKLAGNKKAGRLAAILLFAVLAVGCLIAFAVTKNSGSDEGAEFYSSANVAGDRVRMDIQLLSEHFAQFEAEESDKLYFGLDDSYRPYVICIADPDVTAYEELMKYTYGEILTAPEKVSVVGTLVPFDDDLKALTIESFNWFWEDGAVSAETFTEVFGEYYIDTALEDVSGTPYLFFGAAVVLIFLIIVLAKKTSAVKKVTDKTLEKIGSGVEAERIEAELQDSRTVHLKNLDVYVTEHYVISYADGLRVTSLEGLSGLYGAVKGNDIGLVCRDLSEDEREVVTVKSGNKKQTAEFEQLVKRISVNAPGLEYGVDRIKTEDEVDVHQFDGFFVRRDVDSPLTIQRDMTNADGSIVTPNVGLGILCALGGALIGGVVWFLVGSIGYIAGIVGFLILYLSAMGFKLGAKVMTKGGAVMAVIFTVLTIFAANYLLYSWQLTQAYEGRFTFVECIGKLPELLETESEVMGGFVKDILIGYVFTALAGFSTLKTMFGKKK